MVPKEFLGNEEGKEFPKGIPSSELREPKKGTRNLAQDSSVPPDLIHRPISRIPRAINNKRGATTRTIARHPNRKRMQNNRRKLRIRTLTNAPKADQAVAFNCCSGLGRRSSIPEGVRA